MLDDDADLMAAFPVLGRLDEAAVALMRRAARAVRVPAGTTLFRPGEPCGAYVMVLEGSVRVQMVAETGREIVLYRVRRGETCVITTSCLMAGEDYAAEGVAETDVRAVMVPTGSFRDLMDRAPAFRDFVFASFGSRVTELMLLIQEVAFRRLDVRLARFLLDRREPSGAIPLTHHQIAVELGTAREVVSRLLKEFAGAGLVELGRAQVSVDDPRGLENLGAR
jgi:CRP/FNR family transcriptional regulator